MILVCATHIGTLYTLIFTRAGTFIHLNIAGFINFAFIIAVSPRPPPLLLYLFIFQEEATMCMGSVRKVGYLKGRAHIKSTSSSTLRKFIGF